MKIRRIGGEYIRFDCVNYFVYFYWFVYMVYCKGIFGFVLQVLLFFIYFVKNGFEWVVINMRDYIYDLRQLENFNYIDEFGKD